MPIRDVLELDAEEFGWWAAQYQRDPWGEERADFRNAMLMHLVAEALSVILQVASFKTRKKRLFRMSPLHHHFELSGWSETKVTIRLWIVAAIFALLSISTLKIR